MNRYHLLQSVCSDHLFPCTISAICSSCQTLIADAPAIPAIERHEEQVTKLAAFASTPKSLPRQLHPPRISAHYRLSVGSAFSVPSSSSQEEQVSMYLPEGEWERRNLETLNNAMAAITDGNFTSLPHYVDCKWEALSGASKEEFIIRADKVVSYVLNTIAPSQQEQLWEGVVKRCRSVEDVLLASAILEDAKTALQATKRNQTMPVLPHRSVLHLLNSGKLKSKVWRRLA